MTEPDNLVLEHLRALRAQIEQMNTGLSAKIDALSDRVDQLAERVDLVETRLTGLTLAVTAGFGALVHQDDELRERVERLERERA